MTHFACPCCFICADALPHGHYGECAPAGGGEAQQLGAGECGGDVREALVAVQAVVRVGASQVRDVRAAGNERGDAALGVCEAAQRGARSDLLDCPWGPTKVTCSALLAVDTWSRVR